MNSTKTAIKTTAAITLVALSCAALAFLTGCDTTDGSRQSSRVGLLDFSANGWSIIRINGHNSDEHNRDADDVAEDRAHNNSREAGGGFGGAGTEGNGDSSAGVTVPVAFGPSSQASGQLGRDNLGGQKGGSAGDTNPDMTQALTLVLQQQVELVKAILNAQRPSPPPPAPVTNTPPQPPPPVTNNAAFPLHVTQWEHGADVSGWPETAHLEASIEGNKVRLASEKAFAWPRDGEGIWGNVWAAWETSPGNWTATPFDWMSDNPVKLLENLAPFSITPGATVYFWVSGKARDNERTIEERSNLVKLSMP